MKERYTFTEIENLDKDYIVYKNENLFNYLKKKDCVICNLISYNVRDKNKINTIVKYTSTLDIPIIYIIYKNTAYVFCYLINVSKNLLRWNKYVYLDINTYSFVLGSNKYGKSVLVYSLIYNIESIGCEIDDKKFLKQIEISYLSFEAEKIFDMYHYIKSDSLSEIAKSISLKNKADLVYISDIKEICRVLTYIISETKNKKEKYLIYLNFSTDRFLKLTGIDITTFDTLYGRNLATIRGYFWKVSENDIFIYGFLYFRQLYALFECNNNTYLLDCMEKSKKNALLIAKSEFFYDKDNLKEFSVLIKKVFLSISKGDNRYFIDVLDKKRGIISIVDDIIKINTSLGRLVR